MALIHTTASRRSGYHDDNLSHPRRDVSWLLHDAVVHHNTARVRTLAAQASLSGVLDQVKLWWVWWWHVW